MTQKDNNSWNLGATFIGPVYMLTPPFCTFSWLYTVDKKPAKFSMENPVIYLSIFKFISGKGAMNTYNGLKSNV